MPTVPPYPFGQPDPQLLRLGDGFFDAVTPAQFPVARLRYRNQGWATRLGLGELTPEQWQQHFWAFEPLPGNLPQPLALRYHGHQFGVYNPDLGDGRGFLFAQLRDQATGRLLDLGTKGSGPTPYSRRGDGRLTLKGGIREVLCTERLEALGVYTSKSFSLFETGEMLQRNDEPSPTRSSVLVRLSHSHLRLGSFQRLAHLGDKQRLRALLDYACATHFPHLPSPSPESLLREVSQRLAYLFASYTAAGFVHGVLNTDNLNLTGESFDYGPYRFLPYYDPEFVAAYFDQNGRYAFGRQAEACRWALDRFAEALSLLSPIAPLRRVLCDFEPTVFAATHAAFLRRLGVAPKDPVADALLVAGCLCFLEASRLPFDTFFFDWYGGAASETRARCSPHRVSYTGDKFAALRRQLAQYQPTHPQRLSEPYFQRPDPITLVYDDIERLWAPIAAADDWSLFQQKISELQTLGHALGHAPAQSLATSPIS